MVVPQSKCRFFWPPCIHRDPENHSGPGSGSETKSDLFDVEILKRFAHQSAQIRLRLYT